MPGELLEFYGLREHPFGVSPNPRFLYLSAKHREALATLSSGIENMVGFSALIAEPGVGKTALLFELLRRFKDRATTALISNTQCNGLELVRYIAMGLEIPGWESEQDSIRLYHMLTAFASEHQQTKPVVIVIDEAQNLETSGLETLRLLSNFEAEDRKLLHIILAGQPQFREKLRGNSQLAQRITVITRLGALSPEETEECIAFRLRTAGYTGRPLFSSEAMVRIKQASGGVPRQINRICLNALDAGFAQRQKQIGIEVIEQVLIDLDLSCTSVSEPPIESVSFVVKPRASQLPRRALDIDGEAAGFEAATKSWSVDPAVDISLGDEVLESLLPDLDPSSDSQTATATSQSKRFETEFDGGDAPRVSYAHAGFGPSDDEIRTLLSGMDLDADGRVKTQKPSRIEESRDIEPGDNDTPQSKSPAHAADPRVLQIFAPRKPAEVHPKKIDLEVLDTPAEPVAQPFREDAWNTGVPIDPWGRSGSYSRSSSQAKTQEHEAHVAKPRKIHSNSTKLAVMISVFIAVMLIMHFVIPYISK